MNPHELLFDLYKKNPNQDWILLLILVSVVIWLISVITIAKTKTEDPMDRVVWILIVLSLNIVGTILYVFCYGDKLFHPPSEDEIKRRANEGSLKNPH